MQGAWSTPPTAGATSTNRSASRASSSPTLLSGAATAASRATGLIPSPSRWRRPGCAAPHRVELRSAEGGVVHVVLEIRARRVHVLPPIGKQRRYPALDLTVLHVTERDPPRGREPIAWKLLTDLPVRSRREAAEKIRWHAMRWKVETFHKILKSGCRAEEARLRSAERIANLLALFRIIAWRILWLTLARRADPEAAPQTALSGREITLLDRLGPDAKGGVPEKNTPTVCIRKLARLGGHLGRSRDPPPGIIVLWRGLSRLADIELGVEIARPSRCG